ncbi:MAG: thermonuclease family protein [Pseudomonadota bacterium]
MAVERLEKGAFRKGAPFLFVRGVLLLFVLLFARQALACPLDRADENVGVEYVYDGDTVKLADGRKVRFIGINTPEINHDGGQSDPFSHTARKRLQQLLSGDRLLLRYDRERHDRYGRLLAHPYLPDGRSVSRILLEEGLAAVVVIPPNLWQSDCYLSHEREARAAKRRIWSAAGALSKHSTELVRGDGGFALLRGMVEEVAESRRSLWLELNGNVALRIPKRDLDYFSSYDPKSLAGKTVEARGWLTYHKGKWRMSVRHPGAMQVH